MPPNGPLDPERARLRAALLELTAEHGYDSLSLGQLLRRAGLSPAAFERHFASLEDCFAAVWGEVDAELSEAIASAYRGPGQWRERLRRAFLAGLRYLAADPARARLYITEAYQLNQEFRLRQYDSVARLGLIIDRGRQEEPGVERLPPEIAEVISGAIWCRVVDLVRAGHSAQLPEQLHELMYLAVLPYLGVEAAEAELRPA